MRLRRLLWLVPPVLAAAAFFAPWAGIVEAQLKRQLLGAGFVGLEFTVKEVNLKHIMLSDISFEGQKLDRLSLEFNPVELLDGNIKSLNAGELLLHFPAADVVLRDVKATLARDMHGPGNTGDWQVGGIEINGLPLTLPAGITASGTLNQAGHNWAVAGQAHSADKAFSTSFALDYPGEEPEKAALEVPKLVLPWNGGRVRLENGRMKLLGTEPVRITLKLENVQLQPILALAAGEAVQAKGAVNGKVPLIIGRDGSVHFGKGELNAGSKGNISLPPGIIPGEQAQVALVRDVLQDFHYSAFSIALEPLKAKGKDEQLSILLSLQGNNPAVYNGRSVNLNVRLTGDVMNLLTQSLTILNEPQKLLKETHAP